MKQIGVAFLTALASIFGVSVSSQIVVQPYSSDNNEQSMIIDLLLGSGVVISNVETYGLFELQTGTFTDQTASLGMEAGVILSTGYAQFAQIGMGSGNCCLGTFWATENEDLLTLANTTYQLLGMWNSVYGVYDIISLEFDFIPLGDNIHFNYMFASSEYPGYVNTSYNDVFGFFLSGPEIEGPYSSPDGFPGGSVNIATIPNTDPPLPITVSSVHQGLNSDYYVHNVPNVNIAMNGRTTLLTASYQGLIPGETYHIRLALADGGDANLDSVVLLEAGSFTSEVPADGSAADFNGDGVVNYHDLLILLADMNCVAPPDCIGDLNGDGTTSFADVVLFLELFGIVVGG